MFFNAFGYGAPVWLLPASLVLNIVLGLLLLWLNVPLSSWLNTGWSYIKLTSNALTGLLAKTRKREAVIEDPSPAVNTGFTWEEEANKKIPEKATKRFPEHGEVLSYIPAPIQGVFSRTWYVTFQDGFQAVVQRRTEKFFDIRWKNAKTILGDLVPSAQRAYRPEEHGTRNFRFWVVMDRMAGMTWHEWQADPSWNAEKETRTFESLGNIFSRCFVPGSGIELIESFYLVFLQKLAESDSEELKSAKPILKRLIESVAKNMEGLKKLPALLAHFDLNGQNIMVEEQGSVTGLLDWDAPHKDVQRTTSPQSFGMICGALPFIGCKIVNGRWNKHEDYKTMEKTFWKAMLKGVSREQRATLRQYWEAVRASVQLGVVFTLCFQDRLKKWAASLDNQDEMFQEVEKVDINQYFDLTEPSPEDPLRAVSSDTPAEHEDVYMRYPRVLFGGLSGVMWDLGLESGMDFEE